MSSFAIVDDCVVDSSDSNSNGSDTVVGNGQHLASPDAANSPSRGSSIDTAAAQGQANVGPRIPPATPGETGNNLNDRNRQSPSLRLGKRIRKAPKDHSIFHRHSSKKGETESQFFIGIATAKMVNSSTPERPTNTRAKKKQCKRTALTDVSHLNSVWEGEVPSPTVTQGEHEAGASVLAAEEHSPSPLQLKGRLDSVRTTPSSARTLTTVSPACPSPGRSSRLSLINQSSIWHKWSRPSGAALQKHLEAAIADENCKEMRNGNAKDQSINLELFAHAIWSVVSFVHVRRHLKTRAKAIVKCVFTVLAVQCPDPFRDILMQES